MGRSGGKKSSRSAPSTLASISSPSATGLGSQVHWLAAKVRVLEGRTATLEEKQAGELPRKVDADDADAAGGHQHHSSTPANDGGCLVFQLFDEDGGRSECDLDVYDSEIMVDCLCRRACRQLDVELQQRCAVIDASFDLELELADNEAGESNCSYLIIDTDVIDLDVVCSVVSAHCTAARQALEIFRLRVDEYISELTNARIPTTATMVRGHVFCSWGHRAWQTKCGSRWAPGTSGTCDICFEAIYRRSEIWACDPCNWWACAPCASGILGSDGMKRCGEELLELSGRPPDAFRQISDVALVKKVLKIWMLETLF